MGPLVRPCKGVIGIYVAGLGLKVETSPNNI